MSELYELGWRPFFQSQLAAETDDELLPARVAAVHRDRLEVLTAPGQTRSLTAGVADTGELAVGDWLLLDADGQRVLRVLDRIGAFKRRSAGTSAKTQLIAANVDTVFIVTSANRDFNVARLERYLALAYEAGAFPVVVITKADTTDSIAEYVREAARLAPGLLVEALDARSPEQAAVLEPWCGDGQTVALLGSSGVGKTTLMNTLSGSDEKTRAARADDQRGRHTTTYRSMHRLAGGGWLIDTPGMRELKLVDVGEALDDVFADVAVLAERCRFSDCRHDNEPGCAVQRAIEQGELQADRLRRYRKLLAEDRRNTETLAERRSRDKDLGKLYKTVLVGKRKQRDGN
jgi:ribosome biogenesis GTPase